MTEEAVKIEAFPDNIVHGGLNPEVEVCVSPVLSKSRKLLWLASAGRGGACTALYSSIMPYHITYHCSNLYLQANVASC